MTMEDQSFTTSNTASSWFLMKLAESEIKLDARYGKVSLASRVSRDSPQQRITHNPCFKAQAVFDATNYKVK
jgi:hypothetical protein